MVWGSTLTLEPIKSFVLKGIIILARFVEVNIILTYTIKIMEVVISKGARLIIVYLI